MMYNTLLHLMSQRALIASALGKTNRVISGAFGFEGKANMIGASAEVKGESTPTRKYAA
jgi:hypothetical protein